jgi:hypothetical protein
MIQFRIIQEKLDSALGEASKKEPTLSKCAPARQRIHEMTDKVTMWRDQIASALAPIAKTTPPVASIKSVIDDGDRLVAEAQAAISSRPWVEGLLEVIPGEWFCGVESILSTLLGYSTAILAIIWAWFAGLGQRIFKFITTIRKGPDRSAEDYLVIQNGWRWWTIWAALGISMLALLWHACFVRSEWYNLRTAVIVMLIFVGGYLLSQRPARRGRTLLAIEERMAILKRHMETLLIADPGLRMSYASDREDVIGLLSAGLMNLESRIADVISWRLASPFTVDPLASELIVIRALRVRGEAVLLRSKIQSTPAV